MCKCLFKLLKTIIAAGRRIADKKGYIEGDGIENALIEKTAVFIAHIVKKYTSTERDYISPETLFQ